MPQFVTVAKIGQIPPGGARCFPVGKRSIALFYVDGQYYALDDFCPHAGAALHTGEIDHGMVICDRHRWAFHLADGRCDDAPTLKATTFAVRVLGDEIQVALPDETTG